ncbi:recombinase family protein [Methylobacterium sp. JK268]
MNAVSGSRRIARLRARNRDRSEAKAAIATQAIGYLRVSTEEQASSGYGLEAQERSVRAFALSQGYDLVAMLADPGVSGATRPADRAGFRQVLDLAAAGGIAVLLVHKFDRLARHIAYAVTTANDLGATHGVSIRSVTEPIDTVTPAGRMMFAVLAAMAEAERDIITERTTGGRITKAGRGGIACGRPPYGYAIDREGGLRVVPDQAEVVRRIFAEREAGRILQQIADGLNADRVPSPRGRVWRTGQISYIVNNPKYRGVVEYLFINGSGETYVKTDGLHAAIVDPPRISRRKRPR